MDGDTSSAIKYGVVAAILAGGVIVANRVFETKHHPQANVEEAATAPAAATAAPATPTPPPADASAAPATPAPAEASATSGAPSESTSSSTPAESTASSAPAADSSASSTPAPSTDTASAPAAESAPAAQSAPEPAASEAAAEPSAPASEATASAVPASHGKSGGSEHPLWWNPKHKGFGVSTVGPTNSGASKGVAVVFSSDLADPSAAAKQLVLTHHGAAVKGDWHASGNAKTLVLEGLDAGRYDLKIEKAIAGADGKPLGTTLHGSVDVW